MNKNTNKRLLFIYIYDIICLGGSNGLFKRI